MRRGEIFGLKTEHELHTVIVFQQGIFFWHEAFAPSGFLFLLLFYITRMFEWIWQLKKHYPKWFLVFMGRFFYTVYYWSFHAGYFERILTISIFLHTRMFLKIWQVKKQYPRWFLNSIYRRIFFHSFLLWSFYAGKIFWKDCNHFKCFLFPLLFTYKNVLKNLTGEETLS